MTNVHTYLNNNEKICTMGAKKYRVDLLATKHTPDGKRHTVIYEYWGDYYHKTSCCQNPEEKHPQIRNAEGKPMTWQEIYDADMERIAAVKAEFNVEMVHIIHECQFKRDFLESDGARHCDWKRYMDAFPDRRRLSKAKLTESQVLRKASYLFCARYEGATIELYRFMTTKSEVLFWRTSHSRNPIKRDTMIFPCSSKIFQWGVNMFYQI